MLKGWVCHRDWRAFIVSQSLSRSRKVNQSLPKLAYTILYIIYIIYSHSQRSIAIAGGSSKVPSIITSLARI